MSCSFQATGATVADPQKLADELRKDQAHSIKAVCVVHNETSTGVTSQIAAIRHAMDEAKHPALLMVDIDFIACFGRLSA